MIYDPKWETETKPDTLSLEGVIAWLEKQNPRKSYDYWACNGKCLYGQYMASHGISWDESGGKGSLLGGVERSRFCDLVYAEVACETPYTFGAALERAREALASQQ